ncbi:MAG: thymidylate synthase [Candidatus Nanohaloarchaea archaeon]
MQQYLDTVRNVLTDGHYRRNRTGVDTISTFMQTYEIDLREGFPLLTTKKMDGFRWKSLIHELLWYFSGEEHIRKLREKTGIWNEWADDEGHLETAYGRFWRRYPVPEESAQLEGEAWAGEDSPFVEEEDGSLVFDQIKYVIDTLKGDNPDRDPNSRRLVVNAWHPANAGASLLPPCHYTFVFHVLDGELNVHMTQRSGDIALGVPFNIAAYSLIANIIAQETGFELGRFGHTIINAHAYAGKGERGEFYRDNLDELRERVEQVDGGEGFLDVKEWVEDEAPEEEDEGYDHVPGLLEQLSREPLSRPRIDIEEKPIDELEFDDINLRDYDSHPGISFEVAE